MRSGKRFCILAVAAILTLVQIQVASAQEDTWTTGGPYEASVWSIAIDPTDSMHLYIGTLENFVFETTNGGADWSSISIQHSPDVNRRSGVASVNIHPFGPDTMFMATYRGAYKSADAGRTWSQLFPQWPLQMWEVSEITRGNPPVLFLGCIGSAWRSTDCGRTWTEIVYLPGSVKVIKADPVRPSIIYAATNTTVPNASIFKSTDAGLTWQNIHNNIQYDPPDAYGRGIEVDPVDPDIIYFSRLCNVSEEALLKSTNGGESWTDITPPGLAENRLYGIAVSPVDHNTVFVCSYRNGVLRSADGGATWEEANRGIIGTSNYAQSLTADPRTGFIYLGWYAGGIYRSTDDGQGWEKISYNVTGAQVLDLAANSRNSDTLYATTYNGLYISTDGAASWQYIELNLPQLAWSRLGGVEVDPYDPSYVYASYYGYNHPDDNNPDGALYRSTDGGATWEAFRQGLIPRIYQCYYQIAVADYGGGLRRLYMASEYGLYSSDDLGESWSLCGGGLPVDQWVTSIAVSPVDPDLVFASKYPSGMYKSTDGGESWGYLANAPDQEVILKIVCDPLNAAIVYVPLHWAGDGGIYKSLDGGLTWTEISNNIPYGIPQYENWKSFSGLAVNPLNPENVFVHSYNHGIFQSHNGGESWEDFNLNMETCFPAAQALIDPIDTSRVFLGLLYGSVRVITRTQTGIDLADNILPTAFSASSYPNPFNPSTTIEYSLPEQAFVTMDIYDLLGRKVETLIRRDQRAGRYRVVWDAKDRASGLYYYKINAGRYSQTGIMTLLK